MKFHLCQRLTTYSVASLSGVTSAIVTLCFCRPLKSVTLFTSLCCSEICEQSVWWLGLGVSSRRIVFWFPARATYFYVLHDFQTGFRSHPSSVHWVSLGFVSDKAAVAMKLVTHLRLLSILRTNGVEPPTHTSSCHPQGEVYCYIASPDTFWLF